ncbi:MAG TPA: metallophosphoesterase [Ohtaekwangia sp.]|nr:metallophosphoesterase [Ohtaekwangia sp.]
MAIRMMNWIILIAILLVIDWYVFQAIITITKDWTSAWKPATRFAFWVPTAVCIGAILYYVLGDPYTISHQVRSFLITGIFAVYISKLFAVVVLFIDDVQRGIKWVASFFNRGIGEKLPGEAITRSEFLSKTAVAMAAVPFTAMAYGIISGAHDYRIRRKTVYIGGLPKSFDGIRIAQVSDIHSGSFFNKTAVKGGVEMLMKEVPDLIFFTGDLVNNEAAEVKDYIDIFGKIKAPFGVYSVTGNHDYGDYKQWASADAKAKNLRDLFEAHRLMGYTLLRNENRVIESAGEKIAILGVENWGAGGFSKYGRLDQAHAGTDEAAVKLLLSHDPSHWDAQVRSNYPDIDMVFAGHTHGFQFGVEVGSLKWSPSQYVYKQWAGLYQEGEQYLYVNRGFGYLGYPGRIGMPPEITIIELKAGAPPVA